MGYITETIQTGKEAFKKAKERISDLFEQKQRVETIVETIPDGILVFVGDGNICLANKVFKDYYKKIFNKELPTSLNGITIMENSFGDTIAELFYANTEESITIEPQVDLKR